MIPDQVRDDNGEGLDYGTVMKPLVPIHDPAPKAANRGTPADLLAAILAGLAALTALGYSLYYFTRFLENDAHLWGIVSAFLLCFGLGAFAYVPAAIISRLARLAHKNGARRKPLIWALTLLAPWICLSIVLVFISDLPKFYSLPILATAALLTAWAAISLLRLKPA